MANHIYIHSVQCSDFFGVVINGLKNLVSGNDHY